MKPGLVRRFSGDTSLLNTVQSPKNISNRGVERKGGSCRKFGDQNIFRYGGNVEGPKVINQDYSANFVPLFEYLQKNLWDS